MPARFQLRFPELLTFMTNILAQRAEMVHRSTQMSIERRLPIGDWPIANWEASELVRQISCLPTTHY